MWIPFAVYNIPAWLLPRRCSVTQGNGGVRKHLRCLLDYRVLAVPPDNHCGCNHTNSHFASCRSVHLHSNPAAASSTRRRKSNGERSFHCEFSAFDESLMNAICCQHLKMYHCCFCLTCTRKEDLEKSHGCNNKCICHFSTADSGASRWNHIVRRRGADEAVHSLDGV